MEVARSRNAIRNALTVLNFPSVSWKMLSLTLALAFFFFLPFSFTLRIKPRRGGGDGEGRKFYELLSWLLFVIYSALTVFAFMSGRGSFFPLARRDDDCAHGRASTIEAQRAI